MEAINGVSRRACASGKVQASKVRMRKSRRAAFRTGCIERFRFCSRM